MHLTHRITIAVAALALAATPAALAKKGADGHPGKGKAKSEEAKTKGKGNGKNKAKSATLKGTVVSVSGDVVTVNVTKGNKYGRTHFLGEQQFTAERVIVADTNLDGTMTVADLAAGDSVVVQGKIAKDAVAPFAARKIVDQTNPPVDEDEVAPQDDSSTEVPPVA